MRPKSSKGQYPLPLYSAMSDYTHFYSPTSPHKLQTYFKKQHKGLLLFLKSKQAQVSTWQLGQNKVSTWQVLILLSFWNERVSSSVLLHLLSIIFFNYFEPA